MIISAHIEHAVILAAGMGSRLAEINPGQPKALFTVQGKALLDHACVFAQAAGARERLVVGGYGFEAVQAHLARDGGADLTLLQADDYRCGNLVSLCAALPRLSGSTLVMNVDHLYATTIVPLIEAAREITIFCDTCRTLAADDMKVRRDASGTLAAIAKTLDRYDAGYIGLTYVPALHLAAYRRAAAETRAQADRQASVERVLQTLVDGGHAIYISDVGDLPWAEVDTPADYERLHQQMRVFG